jgi:hypothetical protein
MKIDGKYQIDFIQISKRLDFETSEFKIQKVIENIRIILRNMFDLDRWS